MAYEEFNEHFRTIVNNEQSIYFSALVSWNYLKVTKGGLR